MKEDLTLKEKVALAKRERGFTKGVKWVIFHRIMFALGFLGVFGMPSIYRQYMPSLPLVMTICWLIMICTNLMYGYGIYTFNRLGYPAVMCYWITTPILSIIYEQSFYYNYIGSFYMDSYSGIIVVCQIIYALINIIYFHNRKILFFDGTSLPEVISDDVPKSTNVEILSSYTEYADGRIEYHTLEPQPTQNNAPIQQNILASDNSSNGFSIGCIILGITTTVLMIATIYLYSEMNLAKAKIAELKHEKVVLNAKVLTLQQTIDTLKGNEENKSKYTDYILSYEEDSGFGSFSSYANVIVAEKGEYVTGMLLCDYPATVYSETDNDNISVVFDNEWLGNTIGYTVYTYKTGCTTIHFSNDYNDLKDSVLVIVK